MHKFMYLHEVHSFIYLQLKEDIYLLQEEILSSTDEFWNDVLVELVSTTFLFFPVLAVANTGSCVGPQNKLGHPAGCRFQCWMPAEYKLAKNNNNNKKHDLWYDDLWNE